MKNNQKVACLQDRLKEALKIRGKKAIELNKDLGINRGTISYYLSGKTSPKPDRLKIICDYLDVNEAWMLGYDVSMERIVPNDTLYDGNILEEIGQDALNFGISKSVDILLELHIPPETIKQLILKHFDIRYSEISAILKNKSINEQ